MIWTKSNWKVPQIKRKKKKKKNTQHFKFTIFKEIIRFRALVNNFCMLEYNTATVTKAESKKSMKNKQVPWCRYQPKVFLWLVDKYPAIHSLDASYNLYTWNYTTSCLWGQEHTRIFLRLQKRLQLKKMWLSTVKKKKNELHRKIQEGAFISYLELGVYSWKLLLVW